MSLSRFLRSSGPLVIALLAAVVVTALGVVSFVRALDTFQPLGFEARQAAGGWMVEAVSYGGTGLEVGDQILLANGAEPTALGQTLRRAPTTDLAVLRDGALARVPYRRPPLDVDWAYLILALIGSVYLLIGVYTVLRERSSEAHLFYLWCLASTTLYLFTPSGVHDATGRLLYAAEEMARSVLPPLTLHLFLVFPRPLDLIPGLATGPAPGLARRRARRAGAVSLLYLPAALLLGVQIAVMLFAGRGIDPHWVSRALPVLDRVGVLHLAAFALLALGVLIFRLGRQRDWEEQRQLQWIALGLGVGYVPFLLLYVAPYTLGASLPDALTVVAVVPLAVVPLTFSWAILRYKLWDIAVVVRETASTTLTVLLAGAAFALAHLVVNRALPEDLGLMRDFLSFGSGIAIAGLLLPTRRRVGSALERLQYGRTVAKRRMLEQLGRDLLSERDLEHLCSELLTDLCDGLEIEVANIYLLDRPGTLVGVARHEGAPERIGFDELGDEIWLREVEALTGISFAAGSPGPRQRLFLAGYRYAFPLKVRAMPVGLLVVGYRLGEIPLSSDDLELVRQLAGSAALSIENARLLDELEHRLEEVLELQSFSTGIIESSPAGIAVLDPESRILTANASFGAVVGRERGTLVGVPVDEVLEVEPLPEPGEGLVEVSYTGEDSRERHLQLSVARFQSSSVDGSEASLRVLLVNDVSERAAMEKALREKDRLAALGILAAGVAHEVNTPITGISSYAQMLLAETSENDPRYEVLKKVERQTFRAARIVNNLLEFARNRTDEVRPVDLGPLLGESLDLLSERRAKRGIRLDFTQPEEPLVVQGSDGELQQVITNLALNAIDAMPEGGTLSVAARTHGAWAELVVADTGEGIPPDQLERIFEPFFSTKVGRGGTGLGLSISYDIIRRHGGDIKVTSELGRGTRFTLRLPLDRGGQMAAGPSKRLSAGNEPEGADDS